MQAAGRTSRSNGDGTVGGEAFVAGDVRLVAGLFHLPLIADERADSAAVADIKLSSASSSDRSRRLACRQCRWRAGTRDAPLNLNDLCHGLHSYAGRIVGIIRTCPSKASIPDAKVQYTPPSTSKSSAA